MSNRTLVELNHDYFDRITSPEVQPLLRRYLASGSREDAEQLERFGIRVIGRRHHADKFIIKGDADGFPPHYLPTPSDKGIPIYATSPGGNLQAPE